MWFSNREDWDFIRLLSISGLLLPKIYEGLSISDCWPKIPSSYPKLQK